VSVTEAVASSASIAHAPEARPYSHRVIKVLNNRPYQIISTPQFTQMIKAGEEFESLKQAVVADGRQC
jgi:hypothetical protein